MLISVAVFVGVCSSYIHFLERRRLVIALLAVNSIASWNAVSFVFRMIIQLLCALYVIFSA